MKNLSKQIELIKPDDWHVHLREGEILKTVINFSMRINSRCVVMPNLSLPITTSKICNKYIKEINQLSINYFFTPLIPCYLTSSLNLKDFKDSLSNNIFFGGKLYPENATTNSEHGVLNIESIYPALEILEDLDKPLLVHGEKVSENISIFDREKYFIDNDLHKIVKNFPNLKIVLEHVSSKYGADFVHQSNNMAATVTPHHLLLTKKDVFNGNFNTHHFCMPVVKDESDLIALRQYVCSGNKKFFLGTDSAPHLLTDKENDSNPKPGIFSAPCSIELYASIFDDEDSLENLEYFSSINGPNFYNMPTNKEKIKIVKNDWIIDEYTTYNNIKIKNFFGGKKINWKIVV